MSKWENYKPYWERENKRRPFPPLYEAIRKWGKDNVDFDAPRYVESGYCKYCGNKINVKNRKAFCSNDCAKKFNDITVWNRRRGAYSLRILYRDKFTCQDCGKIHTYINEFGIHLPIDDGELEVHHIIPVCNGGDDSPTNLITLCHNCHLKRHQQHK